MRGARHRSIVENVPRALGGELSALLTVARDLVAGAWHSRTDSDPPREHGGTPILLAHGLFGDITNFRTLRRHLEGRGFTTFHDFSYSPQLDVQRLAPLLEDRIDTCCGEAGAAQVDVVGHSLGGVVARYLLATGGGGRIRRLVTLGSPRFVPVALPQELAVYGAYDVLAGPPGGTVHRSGRSVVLPDCGHLGLLTHPDALKAVTRWLGRPALVRSTAVA